MKAQASKTRSDSELVEAAHQAIERKLGKAEFLRYLQLTSGGRDRFDDLRKKWTKLTVAEVLQRIGVNDARDRPRRVRGPKAA